MAEFQSVIAIMPGHAEVESAVKSLHKAGFDMRKLSVAGSDEIEGQPLAGYFNTGDRMAVVGTFGSLWSWLWGHLLGSAYLVHPKIGPFAVGGPLVGWLVSEDGDHSNSTHAYTFAEALINVGIRQESADRYEKALAERKFVIVAMGEEDEVQRAKPILSPVAESVSSHKIVAPPLKALEKNFDAARSPRSAALSGSHVNHGKVDAPPELRTGT
ncbi:MAG TPA: hypothetical protein V6D17_00615 [Candidatus Obscuribacterales bacterium]